jgi:serine/threonine-protein kinase
VLPARATRDTGFLAGAAACALLGLGTAVALARRGGAGAGESGGAVTGVVTPGGPAPSGGPVVITPGAGGTPPRVSRAEDVPEEARALGSARTELGGSSASVASTAGAALAPAPVTPGRFGRYTLVRTLGAGGMAEVYLARAMGEAGFEKDVALKIMHKNLSTDPKVVDLFLDEARLVSRLAHPNIVQISDLGRSGDDYFIAMEYIDGWDLHRLVKACAAAGQHVPLRVGLTIVRKVCDGLHAAHTAHDAEGRPLELVHRDVKAENVLCSRAGAVKVGDFGIAKANQQLHKTQLGELKGTAAYMAPEHRTGQVVDRRADVYGVGAIAYEVLTGGEINLDLAMLAHLGRQGWPHLKPPSEVRPELPRELDAIVFKALAYDKEERWDSCAAFEEALEAVAEKHGLAASDKVVAQWVNEAIATGGGAGSAVA